MTSYLVEIDLPDNYTEEFEQRIPHQRFMVNKLMEKGTIQSYSLAADRGKLWIITSAASKTQVRNMISSMPLFDYFVEYMIHELMFNETTQASMPQPSLN